MRLAPRQVQVDEGVEHGQRQAVGRRGRSGDEPSGQDRVALGDGEESALAQREQREGRERHDGDGGAQLVEQGVLGPGVTLAEEADRGAVALHHGVAADDDVPIANGHVLGLDDLAGVGGTDLALGRRAPRARRRAVRRRAAWTRRASARSSSMTGSSGVRSGWGTWVRIGSFLCGSSVVHDRAGPAPPAGVMVVPVAACGAAPEDEADDHEEEPRHVVAAGRRAASPRRRRPRRRAGTATARRVGAESAVAAPARAAWAGRGTTRSGRPVSWPTWPRRGGS